MTKRNIIIAAFLGLTVLFGGLIYSEPVLAEDTKTCGGADTSIIECDGDGQNAIFSILSMVIRIMTGAIGLVAVAAVIYGAVLYGTSGDSPENIKKAKEIWTNVVIGLILFAFMVAILEFLVPGGVW